MPCAVFAVRVHGEDARDYLPITKPFGQKRQDMRPVKGNLARLAPVGWDAAPLPLPPAGQACKKARAVAPHALTRRVQTARPGPNVDVHLRGVIRDRIRYR